MKFSNTLFKLGFAFLCACFAIGCTETDDSINSSELGYGYVQFKLYKKATAPAAASAKASRATDELEYLRDAHKITLTLRKDNQTLNQTVLVEEAEPSIAEFGLRTEKLKLMVGSYQLLGYTIYNSVDEKILSTEPESPIAVQIEQSKLLLQRIDIPAKLRGKIQFTFTKDLSGIVIPKASRAAVGDVREFTFNEIAKVDMVLRNQETARSFSITGLKCTFVRTDDGKSHLKCDSLISIEAGDYLFESYTLWDQSSKPLSITDCADKGIIYTIEDNQTCEADVKLVIKPEALYILDYLALKKIYDDMDGENWSWTLDGFPTGAKWNFDKDVDLWYEQPGVMIHPNGRVAALNLGALNPGGPLSPAIGQLDAMLEMWLGTHNDPLPEEAGGTAMSYDASYYSTWARRVKGQHLPQYRWDLYKEEMLARNPRVESEIFRATELKPEAKTLWDSRRKPTAFTGTPKPARPYADISSGYYTNHITSLPSTIGNLVNLEVLFIANGEIAEIPEEIKNCVSLTDLEVYNCVKMVKFPMALTKLPALVSLNIANNPQMPTAEINAGLDALFQGASADKLQILYANGNNMTVFPQSGKNLKKIGLLDLANNQIHTFHPMGLDVEPVQFLLDNNKLTSLPKEICRLDGIELFSVMENKLTSFPNIFTTETEFYMGTVDFSFNDIREIDGYDMQTMELTLDRDNEKFNGLKAASLNLMGNKIKGGFPAAFSLSTTDVNRYNLGFNELDSIGAKGLLGLKFTTTLDLSSNKIEKEPTLEDILVGQEMPFLTGIDLSMNRFKEFPMNMFNGYGITSFFFSSQIGVSVSSSGKETTYPCFSKWPDGIEQYAGIKVLKMDGNDIRAITTFPSNLNYLAIDNNPNISMNIPPDICALIPSGTFGFVYDRTQTGIKGCPALGIGKE